MTQFFRFPVDCQSCENTFQTVVKGWATIEIEEYGEYLSSISDTVKKIEGEWNIACPNCSTSQTREHIVDYACIANQKDEALVCARLLPRCEHCYRPTHGNELCRYCADGTPVSRGELRNNGEECPLCGILKLPREMEEHHTSYQPEETMTVCTKCHMRIHHKDGFREDLKPEMTRDEWKQRSR